MCYCIELCCVTKCPLFIHNFQSSNIPILFILFIENLICIRSARTYIPLPCILFINRSICKCRWLPHIHSHEKVFYRAFYSSYLTTSYSPLCCHIVPSWWYLTCGLMSYSYDDSICLICWGIMDSGNSIISYIFAFSFIITLQLNFSFSSKTYFSCNIRFGDYRNSSLCKFLAYVMRKSKDNQESQVWGIMHVCS